MALANSSSEASSQTEMLSLLRKLSEDNELLHRKISEDNAALHKEVTSLRREASINKASLQEGLSIVVGELGVYIDRKIANGFLNADKTWRRNIRDPIIRKIETAESDLQDTVSTAIEDGLGGLEESLAGAVSTAIADGLDGLEETLGEAVSTAVDNAGDSLGDTLCDAVGRSVDEIMSGAVSIAVSEGLGDIMSEAIGRGLEDLKSTLLKRMNDMSHGISKGTKILRSDIATVQRELYATQLCSSNQDEFAYFPKLPPEIRLMIWKMACFTPNVVKLHPRFGAEDVIFRGFDCSGYRLPAVLHTSQESRREALKWYDQSSMKKDPISPVGKELQYSPKYFNFAIDIFYLDIEDNFANDNPGAWVFEICSYSVYCKFRRIALSLASLNTIKDEDLYLLVKQYSQLEEIVLVQNSSEMSEIKQQLVPARDVPSQKDNMGRSIHPGGPIVHKYVHDVACFATQSDYFVEIMVSYMEQIAELERYALVNGISAEEAVRRLSAPGFSFGGGEVSDEVSDEVRLARRAEFQKRCPEFTIMILKDMYPISNQGMFIG